MSKEEIVENEKLRLMNPEQLLEQLGIQLDIAQKCFDEAAERLEAADQVIKDLLASGVPTGEIAAKARRRAMDYLEGK